jgi:hypothetical protein
MSIELNRRVKDLEAQLAEVNRQIAEIRAVQKARAELVLAETFKQAEWTEIATEKRKPGRPRKDERRTTCQSD